MIGEVVPAFPVHLLDDRVDVLVAQNVRLEVTPIAISSMLRLRRGLPLAGPHRFPAVRFEPEPESAHACEEFNYSSRAPRPRVPLSCRH